MIRKPKVNIWTPEEREQYLQQKNGQAAAPVKEAVNETIAQSVVDAVLDPQPAPEIVEEEISFFDLPDEPNVVTRVVPQPDTNGEFGTPSDGAKFMASFGIPQVALNGKNPNISGAGWQNKGTTDFDEIDRLAKIHPRCNFGSVAKAEAGGFYILETDSVKPKQQFIKDTGLPTFGAKLFIKSGPGRAHWYFAHTKESIALENIGQNNPEGFSLRLNNEQCVSPGSVHPERKTQYAVQLNGTPEPASLQLIEWLRTQKIAANIESQKGEAQRNDAGKIPLGMIHNFLLEEMGHLRGRGYTMEATEDALLAYSEQNCEVHDPAHIHQMVTSTDKWGEVNPLSKAVLVGGQLSGTNPHVATASPDGKHKASEEDRKTKYVRAISIEEYKEMVDVTTLFNPSEEGHQTVVIPPFDPTTMTGLAKDMTLLAIRGTTLSPQFIYGIAKTLITARMAGNVIMEGVSAEPTRYFVAVGETGTGKGEAWRRLMQIMQPEGMMDVDGCGLKFINSADSGAGLKDFFFHYPEDWPVVCYVDEIASLGNKTTDKKQPEILDTIIELADSTTISRVLADQKGQKQVRSKNNAQLAIVACGQDGKAYGQAFGTREKQGIFDRLTPEYGEPTEAGDLDRIDLEEAFKMLQRFKALPYKAVAGQETVGVSSDSGNPITKPKFKKQHMTMSTKARELLTAFWNGQPKQVKDKARFRKNLMLEAQYNAFGNSRIIVEADDMEKAIRTFTRELAIRAKHFNTPIGDRVGFYSALIKEITEKMIVRLVRGEEPEAVAQTKRDYLTKTNAYRNNEEHLFFRAWISHEKDYLIPIKIQVGRNRRWVEKYLPAPID